MTPNFLCLSTDLPGNEAAAWLQAVGSILAILGVVWIARYQARKQRQEDRDRDDLRRRSAQLDTARVIAELAKRSWQVAGILSAQITDRARLYDIIERNEYVDMSGLKYLEGAVTAIPLHLLPYRLLMYPVTVSGCLRQIRERIELVFRAYKNMNAAEFGEFFKAFDEMVESLKQTTNDVETAVQSMESVDALTTLKS